MNGDRPQAEITSSRNRWIKLARSLHRRRQRYSERAILVEGVRPVREALESGVTMHVLLLSTHVDNLGEAREIAESAADAGVTVLTVDPRVFQTACDTETPQGILAICKMPETQQSPSHAVAPLYLITDRVRDPGNLGTLLRSALGAGVNCVLVGPESADPFAPKVIRAGAGSQFRIPIAFLSWDRCQEWLENCSIVVADAAADVSYDEFDWTTAAALVVGNETQGPSDAAISHADGRVGIPLANSLESLNAGVAGSVILFEAWRQRRRPR
ncbi:MAG: RNA methyltransferase [Thermomicrobiaceae bacterium]